MGRDIAAQLVEFAVRTKYESIPEEVLEYTKCLTLKTVAGMIAGSVKPSGHKMTQVIKNMELPEVVRVMGCGFKTSLWEAVFLHSYFAHASELEDDRFEDGISWDITVISLLLPLAAKLKLSGKALLEALVTGLEVHTRTCIFSGQHLGLFLIPGAVGPAIGASKALGLGYEETMAAFGLAISGVPLSRVNLGTDGHFFESALMSLQGLMAAEMAKVGLKGNPDVAIYLRDYLGSERVIPEKMVEDLEKRWALCEIQIKKFPCCLITHRQIDSVIGLKKDHNLSYEDIEVIEVRASPGDTVCDRPEPKDENDIQFSFQHVIAAAMLDGDVTLGHMTEEALFDQRIREARNKVKFILDPCLDSQWLKVRSLVAIKTKDGREFLCERMHPVGHPKDPLTIEQVQWLYAKFTKGILSEIEISRTAEMIMNLEGLKDVTELLNF